MKGDSGETKTSPSGAKTDSVVPSSPDRDAEHPANNLFSRVVNHVTGASTVFSPDGNYDMFGLGSSCGNNNSLNNSTLSLSGLSLLDDSSSSSATLRADSSLDDGYPNTPTQPKVWNKENSLKITCDDDLNEPLAEDKCDLCYFKYNLPFSPPLISTANNQNPTNPGLGYRCELLPVLGGCRCSPCQCTFENNYCGCHSDDAAPCY